MKKGFTIVELLVVIVVIAILAAITIVAYTGVAQKANVAAITSDLTNSAQKLKLYYTDHGSYPSGIDSTTLCPTGSDPSPDNRYCLKSSSGTILLYSSFSATTFTLTAVRGNNIYSITESSSPTVAVNNCPSGFIPVPGSATYGTSNFCVMKYEAKQVGATTTPISQASGAPWVNISQATAITNSPNVVGCTGCHLITEAEWLTIAQNVLSVPNNWSSGTVGTGYIYSGHNQNATGAALAADTNDSNGYYGETGSPGANQLRTLMLNNGQIIWDLAGNVYEWTSGTISTYQPGVVGDGWGSLFYREWTAITYHGTISPDPFPATTGISGASTWNSSNGIGVITSNADYNGFRVFKRSGSWNEGLQTGVLRLSLGNVDTTTDPSVGFRVSQ